MTARASPRPPALAPPAAPSPRAGVAGLPRRPGGAVARRAADRRAARRRSDRDRPVPPLRAAVGRALAGHRRSRPRPLPAPARRRPRLAAGRPLGRAAVGRARRRDRRGGGLSRRPPRRLPDAADRRRHRPAAAAAADRPGRHRSAQDRRAGRDRPVRDLLALSHRRHRGADRLDDRGAAGARRDAVAQGARLHPRRRRRWARRRARIMFRHILPNAAGSLVVATTMSVGSADPARIDAVASSASASSRRPRAGATC